MNENFLLKRIKAYLECQRNRKSFCVDPTGKTLRRLVRNDIKAIYFFGQITPKEEFSQYEWK